MQIRTRSVYGVAAVLAICAAAMLIVAFLVTDAGVVVDARSPAGQSISQ
jgi:hypothetical protein